MRGVSPVRTHENVFGKGGWGINWIDVAQGAVSLAIERHDRRRTFSKQLSVLQHAMCLFRVEFGIAQGVTPVLLKIGAA